MKILLINSVYNKGSTGNIVKSLYEGYKELGHDAYVIYGRGEKAPVKQDNHIFKSGYELESKIHHFISLFSGNMYGAMPFSTSKMKRLIRKINPDVIHVHCLNGYYVNMYSILKYLAKTNKKVCLTMHADFMMTGGCGMAEECNKYLTSSCEGCIKYKSFVSKYSLNKTKHNYLKLMKSIIRFDSNKLMVTCVSPWLRNRYLESEIYKKYEIFTVLNPVDDIFFTEKATNSIFIPENNILFVTPDILDPLKGGQYIDTIAKKLPMYHFTVVNSKKQNFLFNSENITYLSGGLEKKHLKTFYSYSLFTLLLSTRETFCMVAAESIVCGTPVVGLKNGGTESFLDSDVFISFRDIFDLIEHLKNCPTRIVKSKINIVCFTKCHISKRYIDLFNC